MNLSVLGSTGSIGRQTLELAECYDDINITGLAAFGNTELIYKQIHEFEPEICCIYDENKALELKAKLKSEDSKVKVVSGMEGLIECAVWDHTDTVLVSVV